MPDYFLAGCSDFLESRLVQEVMVPFQEIVCHITLHCIVLYI